MKALPVFSLLLLTLLPVPAAAQGDILESSQGRLPEDTLFYLSWKNTDEFEQLQSTNPLLRLLGSPEMEANWQSLMEFYRQQEKYKQAQEPAGTAANGEQAKQPSPADIEWSKFYGLLENPGLVAFLAVPGTSTGAAPEPALVYLYDATGKEELLAELVARSRKLGVEKREYDLDGITVVETLAANGKSQDFQANIGRWQIGGTDKATAEAWIRAFREAPAGRTLKDAASYQRARKRFGADGQLEFFLNVGAFTHLLEQISNNPPGEVTPAQVADALGVNDWDFVLASLDFEPDRVRYQLAGLYSAGYDGELNIVGSPAPDFASLDFAPEDALSYSVMKWNLSSAWAYVRHALTALVPPEKAQAVDGMQAMLESVLGVTLDEFTTAWGPEYAQMSFPAGGEDKVHSLFAISLRDRDLVLTSLRNLLPMFAGQLEVEELPAEGGEAGTTYFQFSLPRAQESAPTGEIEAAPAQPSLSAAALTHNWFLFGHTQEEIRRALDRSGQSSSLRDSPNYQQARAQFPDELSGFSYVDIDRWAETGAMAVFLRELAKGLAQSASRKETATEKSALESPVAARGEEIDAGSEEIPAPEPPEFTFPRGYLRWFFAVTTRDAGGLYHSGVVR